MSMKSGRVVPVFYHFGGKEYMRVQFRFPGKPFEEARRNAELVIGVVDRLRRSRLSVVDFSTTELLEMSFCEMQIEIERERYSRRPIVGCEPDGTRYAYRVCSGKAGLEFATYEHDEEGSPLWETSGFVFVVDAERLVRRLRFVGACCGIETESIELSVAR